MNKVLRFIESVSYIVMFISFVLIIVIYVGYSDIEISSHGSVTQEEYWPETKERLLFLLRVFLPSLLLFIITKLLSLLVRKNLSNNS